MKKITTLVWICLISSGLFGCGTPNDQTARQQSRFKQNFSIGVVVEAHQELLREGPRTLSGSEAGTPEPFIQNQEVMTLQIDGSNAAILLEAIRSDIMEAISSNGATILGSSGVDIRPDPIAYFSYDYGEGPFYGVINVWGVQGEGHSLILIAEITESKTRNE